MSQHKRSRFNQFLDRCPTWVQEEVWGENGLRATIETLEARVRELESELSDHDSGVARRAFEAGVYWWADVCVKTLSGQKVYTPSTQEAAREYAKQIREETKDHE